MSKQEQQIRDSLVEYYFETLHDLPYAISTIADIENRGGIVDLLTGEVFYQKETDPPRLQNPGEPVPTHSPRSTS